MVEKPGSSPAGGEPARTTESTYQVVRLIRFAIELRDAEPVQRHEDVFGRDKRNAAAGRPPGRPRAHFAIEDHTEGGTRPGFPSYFPPADAGPRGAGRYGWGRRGTAGAIHGPFAHVISDGWQQVGMERDSPGDGAATCKIAGIAYTGSNPVPATTALTSNNAVVGRLIKLGSRVDFPSTFPPPDAQPLVLWWRKPVQRRLARNCRSTLAASSCPISSDAERSVAAGTASSGSARASACRPSWTRGRPGSCDPGRLPGLLRSGRSGPGRRRGRRRCRLAARRRPGAACLRCVRRGRWPRQCGRACHAPARSRRSRPCCVAPSGQHVAAAG
jgi:hypothetical protein